MTESQYLPIYLEVLMNNSNYCRNRGPKITKCACFEENMKAAIFIKKDR